MNRHENCHRQSKSKRNHRSRRLAMSGCCDDARSLERLREQQRGTLYMVLGINAVMFFVIVSAALYGNSTALLADSLDNLGDALTYGLSLYAVSRSTGVLANDGVR